MLRNLASGFDRVQQRHRWLGFPLAVWKKFGDDQGSNLVALVAFYGFVSLFPLLLVLITVLDLVLSGHPGLQQHVLNSALVEFPIVGQQILANLHGFHAAGLGLVLGVLGCVLGARGLSGATQNALNTIWGVPRDRRPGFPGSWLRSYALIGVMGLGLLATATLSGFSTWSGGTAIGYGIRVAAVLVSLAVNVALFWVGMCLATAPEVRARQLWLGALLAAVVWQALQLTGTYIVAHQLRHASELYGTFGVVLGLVAWLSLQATLTLYAAEIDVVRARRQWPRRLFGPEEADSAAEAGAGVPDGAPVGILDEERRRQEAQAR